MRRAISFILAFQIAASLQAAPIFVTGGTAAGSSFSIASTGTTTGNYINLGLQGVGRISSSQLDAFGETFGSVSSLQISNWKVQNGVYSGSFFTLPDRGYNTDAGIYSAYRTRVQQLDFTFTPYTGSSNLAAATSSQNQIQLNYKGGSLLKIDGLTNTTGDNPTNAVLLKGGSVGTVASGKVSIDAEGLAQFADGSGYISDEYGPNVYYFDSKKNLVSVINPPASALPVKSGTLKFTALSDPTTGRRSNQGMEAIAVSPDGTTMYAMMQSALMQDAVSKSNSPFTRLYKFDISTSKSNPTLIGEYVVELPRFNDTNANQTGLLPNKTGAQSEMVALDNNRFLLLSRDGNGNGTSAAGSPTVYKSAMIVDLTDGNVTNIKDMDTTADFSVVKHASGNTGALVTDTTSTPGDTKAQLKDGIVAAQPKQFVNFINTAELAKFGLNTNDGSVSAPRTNLTLSEKWEGMTVVSALDPNKPNDYFLFVANDNDFITYKMKMKGADGTVFTGATPVTGNVENDTVFMVFRITIPDSTNGPSLLSQTNSANQAASNAVFNAPATITNAGTLVSVDATTMVMNSSVVGVGTLDVGPNGGAINLQNSVLKWNGIVQGSGGLSIFSSGSGKMFLSGASNYLGETNVSGTRLEVSQAASLGTGQLYLNAGATLSLAQSGTYNVNTGFYVNGGTIDVKSGKVIWNGSLSGPGDFTKSGGGILSISQGIGAAFSGSTKVNGGVLSLGLGVSGSYASAGKISLSSKSILQLNLSGTVDLSNSFDSVASDSIVLWKGNDANSILELPASFSAKVYNIGSGSVMQKSGSSFVNYTALTPTAAPATVPSGVSGKELLYVNGKYYQPFSADLAVGTTVYLDADSSLLRATQRSLGFREVAYKKQFFNALAFTGIDPIIDAAGNIIYNYGTQSTSTSLTGYWTKKNLPIIIGIDGNAYITDGHHTSAGYLETDGAQILPGSSHIVLGTIQTNPSSQTSVNDQMWTDFSATNNAYLYGTNGSLLAQAGDAGYSGLQPILPGASGVVMPTTPGAVSMANDLYRSLTWATVDAVVKTATNNGSKIAGYKKVNSTISVNPPDVNFVEFYWADFLRNRIMWNDNAAVTSPNLINAPVSFFAAAANGIALSKSELYRDQYGRNLVDYTGSQYSTNTKTWAQASLINGLAASGDIYNMFLTDDAWVQGDILMSGSAGVTNNISINTVAGMNLTGAVRNVSSLSINTGGTMTIDWKDAAVNAVAQNKTLSVAAGTGNVTLSGSNDYSKLTSLTVATGSLAFDTTGATVDQIIGASVTGAGTIVKQGLGTLTFQGDGTGFVGKTALKAGTLKVASQKALTNSTLDVAAGTVAQLTGTAVNLGGLNGSGTVSLADNIKLTIGGNNQNTAYSSLLSGNGISLEKVGSGMLSLSSVNFTGGSTTVSGGVLNIGTGGANGWAGTSKISLGAGAVLEFNMSGTLDLTNSFGTVASTASIFWKGTDANSKLVLPTNLQAKVFNIGAGSVQQMVGGTLVAYTPTPSAPVTTLPAAPTGVTGKVLLYINGAYYQPYSKDLAVGTPVYLDADGGLLRATQRSLGFREVAYKQQFFNALAFTSVDPVVDVNGNLVYNYGTQSTSSSLTGYWTKKNLPIIIGIDGNAYITDGHHTSAGYLATAGAPILPGTNHVVIGTIQQNPSSQTSINDQMWTDFAAANDAYLYGTSGNLLALPGDANYGGLQPILPISSGTLMPTIPGTASMANDLYRSLTWATVDAVVKTATSASGAKIAGYKKVNSTISVNPPDVNFVEFYWADFLRNRIMWNDNAAVTSPNLINAPVSFFAAAANGIALSKSELYRDQFGRNLNDYTGSQYSTNTQTWANASLLNGLATAGDTYNMFLLDDATIQGDILPSGLDGVTNNLNINTTTGLTIAGALQNFSSIVINTGGTMTIDWKDAAVNAVAQNKTLSIAPGTGNVVFSGDLDFTKLGSLTIGAGTLTINTSNSIDPEIWGSIDGAGGLRKSGSEALRLSGWNTFQGGVSLDEGVLVLGSASPIGSGTLTVKGGATLAFEESVLLKNSINFVAGTGTFTAAAVSIDLGDNSVEFAGKTTGQGSLTITGQDTSVLTLSGSNNLTGTIDISATTVRLSGQNSLSSQVVTLRSGGAVQAKTDLSMGATLVLVDEGRLDGGESLFEWAGEITGAGHLTITGHPFGAVRLSGLNTYTGGTLVDRSRVEVGANGASATSDGNEQAFGTGDVVVNSGVLGFAVAANVQNNLEFRGQSSVDVGDNVGVLSGYISGDGSLAIRGSKAGVLFLNGAINAYQGALGVEGTTLRVLSSAGSDIFGDNANAAVSLDNGTIQIIPDLFNPVSIATYGTRGLELSAAGGTLDINDNDVRWDGVISGLGKFTVNGSMGNQLELTGVNTFKGGIEVTGGAFLKFTSNTNLGDASGAVTLSNGGLVYGGNQSLTMSRNLWVNDYGVLDAGNQTVTWSGVVGGDGVLEVGRTSTSGNVILSSANTFAGTTVLMNGGLTIAHKDALANSTLQMSAAAGSVAFTTSEANLGGLAGDKNLALATNFKLTVGGNNSSSVYSGILSGTGVSLTKVGNGNLTLGGVNSYTGITSVKNGTLTIDTGATFGTGLLSLNNKVSLVINATDTVDFSTKFDVTNVAADSIVVFRGAAGSILKLPKELTDKISVLNLGSGKVQSVTGGVATDLAASTNAVFNDGVTVALPVIDRPVTLSGSSKLTLNSTTGTPEIKGSLLTGGKDSTVEVPAGVNATIKEAATAFSGALQADGTITVDPTSSTTPLSLPSFKGTGTVGIADGGKVKLADSSNFSGTTTLGIGSVAELSGSLGKGGALELGAGASVNVNPTSKTQTTTLPALTGGDTTAVSLKAGKIELDGDNSAFKGTISIDKGVSATFTGNLPAGKVITSDTLTLDASAGNVTLPGTVSGSGVMSLASSGSFTMTADAKIQTSELKIGATSSEKPTLDVSNIVGGLVLQGSQTLSGGGTVIGSVTSNGIFSPGNSPGTFTIASKTTGATATPSDLTIGAGGTVIIEYGVVAPSTTIVSDQVNVSGTLTFNAGSTISVRPYGSFVTPLAATTFANVFTYGSLVGAPAVQFVNGSYLLHAAFNAAFTDLTITKDTYELNLAPGNLRNLAAYLTVASQNTPSASLTDYLAVLDASTTAAELRSSLQGMSSQVYAESQRVSLHRTAVIVDTIQSRLTGLGFSNPEGWAAWSESYDWSFHRDGTAASSSWNVNTAGEIAGVQHTKKGLTLGVFGAAGHSSGSFSSPSTTLRGENFHGGAFAHIETGISFFDASAMLGSADQTAVRQVLAGTLGASSRAAFQTTEYALHLRTGVRIPKTLGGCQFTPSAAIVCNGYTQDGVNENGAGGAAVMTDKASSSGVITRLGTDAVRPFKWANKPGQISASAYWLHDFENGARSVNTRLAGASAVAGSYTTSGDSVGADAFEIGLGATLGLTPRTSVRANGAWQIRDGSSQPGFNLGLTVQF